MYFQEALAACGCRAEIHEFPHTAPCLRRSVRKAVEQRRCAVSFDQVYVHGHLFQKRLRKGFIGPVCGVGRVVGVRGLQIHIDGHSACVAYKYAERDRLARHQGLGIIAEKIQRVLASGSDLDLTRGGIIHRSRREHGQDQREKYAERGKQRRGFFSV